MLRQRLGLMVLLAAAAWHLPAAAPPASQPQADIGPRRPQRPLEVDNPKDYLSMEDEAVDIHVQGGQAHVRALFHFDASTVFRTTIISRLGFPELLDESPLRDFKVAQAVGDDGRYPDKERGLTALTPVTDLGVERGWGPLCEGSNPPAARWKTWPLEVPGTPGPPPEHKVTALVTYTQALTPVHGRKGVQRLTYVLRSGAPWRGPHRAGRHPRHGAREPPGECDPQADAPRQGNPGVALVFLRANRRRGAAAQGPPLSLARAGACTGSCQALGCRQARPTSLGAS